MNKVLVVDDEPSIVEVLRFFLTRKGCSVQTASDGSAALRAVRAERPDMIFLDLRMPGMSGLEVLRCIREIDQAIVIVVLSGLVDEEMRKLLLDMGAHSCLAKPVDLPSVERTLMMARGDAGHKRGPVAGDPVPEHA